MSQNKVRFIQQSDKNYWLEMWQEYIAFYQTTLPAEVTNNTLLRLLSDDPNIGCIIACDSQDVPIGFLNYVIHLSTWTIAPEWYLQDLYVKPQHRQDGVARLLVNELKKISAQQKCAQIYWITKPDNHTAQTFYNKIAEGEPWIVYVMIPQLSRHD